MGFEPMVQLRTIVFKTITLDHSGTSPEKFELKIINARYVIIFTNVYNRIIYDF